MGKRDIKNIYLINFIQSFLNIYYKKLVFIGAFTNLRIYCMRVGLYWDY
jgi:hypothetical protein